MQQQNVFHIFFIKIHTHQCQSRNNKTLYAFSVHNFTNSKHSVDTGVSRTRSMVRLMSATEAVYMLASSWIRRWSTGSKPRNKYKHTLIDSSAQTPDTS